jgi:hypothetical protein
VKSRTTIISGTFVALFACLAVPPIQAAVLTTVTFTGSNQPILNPERGYVAGWDLMAWDPSGERAQGRSMLRGFVNLSSYSNAPLDQAFLTAFDASLARVRKTGLKTTVRFKYNDGAGYPHCLEASKSQMLQHIAQLGPVLQKYADVIVSYEAGFAGCWGEFGNGSSLTTADKAQIIAAMLASLPSRMVQVRTPDQKASIYGTPNPMTASDAYGGTNRDRTMEYNDCILSTSDGQDYTYQSPIAPWIKYVQTESKWGPMGGETCASSGTGVGSIPIRGYCTQAGGQAQPVLAGYHFSYLNQLAPQVDLWTSQGCSAEIGLHLGYRFILNTVSYSSSVSRGAALHMDISLFNSGYAAPFNPRPVFAVLDGNSARYELPLPSTVDPRRWASGQTSSFSVDLPLPATIAPGTYRLSLWLPDSSTNIRADSRFAIRFANQNTWDAATGVNVITTALPVTATSDTTAPSAPEGLVATHTSSSQVTLSWAPSTDNIEVVGYRIYRVGSEIGSTAKTTYTDSALKPATYYSYSVAAYDAAGNLSAHSTPSGIMTLP